MTAPLPRSDRMHPDLPPADVARLDAALAALSQLRASRDDAYLDAKETQYVRAERVRSYLRIRPGLVAAQRVLDWGCRHGAAAQLVRADLGDETELHGADFCDSDEYRIQHQASAMTYRRLEHAWRLDYTDEFFGAVIGAGVLEHVANIGESLTELWRVLRPGGALLLTHLPNAHSWSEWLSRRTAPQLAHARRFRPKALAAKLLDHGFAVEQWGYHHFPPTSLPPRGDESAILRGMLRLAQPLRAAEGIWPLRGFSAAIWLIARKRLGF
jgi:2-polyprenyl-3-methyl-5-hydroxy-6-metoxy-1,4-benzoquinol methylase